MSEFQSFPTSNVNPLARYGYIPVSSSTMSPQTSRLLWFSIEGSPTPYLISNIPIDTHVNLLKGMVQQRVKILHDIDPDGLKLRKLNVVVPVDPDHSLAQRLAGLGNIATCSRELSSGERVGALFPGPHSEDILHIVVQCPPDDRPSSKRLRLSSPTSNELEPEFAMLQSSQERWLEFFNELWGKGLKNFQDQYIIHQPDNNGVSFRKMKNHRAFGLNLKGLLVRDEWDVTWDWAEKARDEHCRSFIIVGQTGIGKTLSLYYLLARRLALGLTTFFQYHPDYVWFFNENGVRPLASKMPWQGIQDFSNDQTAWALVDSNKAVQDPALLLFERGSPFFIVEASSPRRNRWGWVKYHGKSQFFYTNPFSLEEILWGNLVQPQSSNEANLKNFFIEYGPSARECYSVTVSPTESGLIQYHHKLHQAITRMTCDEIVRVVSEEDFEPKFDDETSFLIVLIRPTNDEQRITYRATIITRTILRSLWKAHRVQLQRKSRELFHLFSRKRETSVTAGWLFETMVHDLLEEGINVPIDPMVVEQNNRPNAVNDKHVASNIGTKIWKSSAMKYVPFTQNHRALDIQPLHYYVPVDPSHPTYNSFTFELVPCASYEGPILNPKDKEIYDKTDLDENSNIALFTTFQVTTAAEHDLNEKGFNYICMIADQNKLKAIGIRYVGITPAGEERIFKTPVAWRGKLDMYSLPIALYEPKV